MKALLFFFLLIGFNSFSQLVGGTLVDEGRKLSGTESFIQEGTVNGWAVYDLAVDREGNVTSAVLKESNLTRTSAKFQIRNYMMTMKFEPGTHFPKFHHVDVKITLVKPKGDE